MAAEARIDVQMVGTAESARRLDQITKAEQRLQVQFKGGFISSEQLRKSTERLGRAKALLARRLDTTSANLRRANRAATSMTASLTSMRSVAAAVGVTFGLWQVTRILTSALRTAAEFEAEMNRVKALTGATREEFIALEATAKKLGSSTVFSARQAGNAMAFLAQAGFSVNEIVGSMRDTLNLAAAAGLDLGTAADIVSNVMSGFGIRVEDLSSAVDVLSKASVSANTDLLQLGQAMKLAGPVAKQFGLTFEETTAAIALMGNAGFQSTLAGTALRGALIRLAASAKKFGIDVFDANRKLLPLVEIMKRLRTAGLSDTEMFDLLGQRAGPAFAALLSQGVQALERLTTELRNAGGTAENIAKVKMEGLKGAVIELTSAWEGLQISLAKTEGLQAATQGLAGLLRAFTLLGGTVKEVDSLFQIDIPASLKGLQPLAGEDLRLFQELSAISEKAVKDAKAGLLAEKEAAEAAAAIAAGSPLGLAKAEKARVEAKARAAAADIEAVAKAREAARKRFVEEAAFNKIFIKLHREKLQFFAKAEEDFLREAKKRQEEQLENKLAVGQREFEQLVEKLMNEKLVLQTIEEEERELGILRAQLAGDTVTAIVLEEERRVEETLAGLEEIGAGSKDLARARQILAAQTAVKIAEENKRAFNQMAQQIDFFFQRAALGAKSFSDLFKQIWTQLLSFFISQVSRMVAAWVLGQKQMQAAGAGGGGGGIGSILSGLFGGGSFGGIFGSATAPGGTGTFSGAPIGSNLVSGGGVLAGVPGIGVPTGLPPPPAGSASGIQAQQTLLSRLGINLRGIGPIPGGVLASGGILATLSALQSGSPLTGALLGAGGGALLGFAFGGPIGAAIGAVVGAITGLISGIFGRGKRKRQAGAAQELLTAQLGQVIDNFKSFQIDLEGALANIDQLFASFQGQVKPLGKAGRRAVKNISPLVFRVKDRLTEIQAARDARAALSIFGQIPEFAHGGLVPSLLHSGEFVFQRKAVQQVGVQNLERLNAGQSPMGNVNVTVHVHPTPGMDERAVGEMAAREIARRFRNRGLQFGG